MTNLNLGLDPEYFAVDSENNCISPALLMKFGGLKKISGGVQHPYFISNKDFGIMMDGVAFEITYYKIFHDPFELFKTIADSLDALENLLNSLEFAGEALKLVKKPVVSINPEMYLPLLNDESIYQGFIFGCDRDWDAILPNYKCETINVEKHLFRYGGGHIHISGIDEIKEFPIPAVKLLAITVGNFVVRESLFPEEDKKRVETYGRPGRFRTPTYKNGVVGIEYRTPSNSWTSLPENKMEELIYWIDKAMEYLKNPIKGSEVVNTFLEDSVKAITNYDKALSSKILDTCDGI